MLRLEPRSKTLQVLAYLFISILFLLNPWDALSEEKAQTAFTADDELEEELKYLKAETYVITPSRIPQRIEKAPGAVYVVTDRQIRQMGARYLSDVVATVPGWFSYYPGSSGKYQLGVRGTSGFSSSSILVMVNSHIVNDPLFGGAVWGYSSIDLDNVKRIEFVNAGLSSVYGANAYGGIINILTKDAEEIDGLQLTARGGSDDTWQSNALFGKSIKGLEIAAYLNHLTTDWYEGRLEQDRQTLFDRVQGTHASLAPGNMKGDLDRWDAQFTMAYKGFKFDGKYIDWDWDTPFGFAPILNKISKEEYEQYYLTLSYEFSPMDGLDLLTTVYKNHYLLKQHVLTNPKGGLYLASINPRTYKEAPEDKFINWEAETARKGVEAQATYEIVDSNTVIAGATYEEMKLYPLKAEANFAFLESGAYADLSYVQDFPDWARWSTEENTFWSLFAEDMWDITEDLRLTIGGRYDYYSDFGGQFSPRAGLNWGFLKNYYVKLLYDRAFRVPSFWELYDYADGNPDLEPETSEGFSLTLGGTFLRSLSGTLTFFYRETKDIITYLPTGKTKPAYQFINTGIARSRGAEMELKYDFGRGTYLAMNYTYTTMQMHDPDENLWNFPKHVGTLMGNVRLTRHLNLNSYLLYRGGWTRPVNDPRDDPPDYAIVNATLIARNFGGWFKGFELRGSVYNLFDRNYKSPQTKTFFPEDMPMPDRAFLFEVRYRF